MSRASGKGKGDDGKVVLGEVEEISEDDDDDVEMADATAKPTANGKRKADDASSVPAKKTKAADGTAVPSESTGTTKTIFVGRLSWNVDNDWLAQEFAECGEVVNARVQMDRNTGRSRGFGFVTPEDGGQDVFLHSSVLQRAGRQDVQQGERVELEVRDGQRGRQAVNLK